MYSVPMSIPKTADAANAGLEMKKTTSNNTLQSERMRGIGKLRRRPGGAIM
jgi:hypothetical protein